MEGHKYCKIIHGSFKSLVLASIGFVGLAKAETCCFCRQEHAADIPCPNAGVYGESVRHLTSFIHAFDGLPMDVNMEDFFEKLRDESYNNMAVLQALNVIFNGQTVDYSMVASPAFRINGVEYSDILRAINYMAVMENYRNDHRIRIYKDAYDAFVTALEKYINGGPSEEGRKALFDILVPHVITPDPQVVEYDGNYQMLYLVRLLACLPDNMRDQLINTIVASDPERARRIALQSPQGVYTEGAIELLCMYFKDAHGQGREMIGKLKGIKDELKNGECSFKETGKAIFSILEEQGYWERFSIDSIGRLIGR